MPNKPVIQLWVDALRSGTYNQAHGNLHIDGKFCCLGVLCDLHRQQFGGKWDEINYLGKDSFLPIKVSEWAGLPAASPKVKDPAGGPMYPSLTDLNDGDCDAGRIFTFHEIARAIEQEWLK